MVFILSLADVLLQLDADDVTDSDDEEDLLGDASVHGYLPGLEL